ncbi:hypothetical protein I302_102602 [Kwoniella bestiolae CBS 10118]|uniref:Methyltransferase type 11 domain-containing protein n=1 Tax=Kwoniella bestiolae CBS 10118 TaxID=1296100 RepID=A0A1B9GFJ4_9TREE|nr:hypothetical protein I302_01289 [Kwoniella bestiolae CBS 10118]OCF29776.1 hypothetical protein I302_01289 [Kwoniella bestiolae CBS 10118]
MTQHPSGDSDRVVQHGHGHHHHHHGQGQGQEQFAEYGQHPAHDHSAAHSHSHDPPHNHGQAHEQVHSHGHMHAHGHGHGETDADLWEKKDYLAMPGVFEVAQITHETILHALTSAGISEETYKAWDVLEIGSGPGTVTKHLLSTFASVHSIDVSPAMLLTLSQYLPAASYPTLSYSLHTLSPDSPNLFHSKAPLRSPTEENKEREVVPPRGRFDLAVCNLVLHHVDDIPNFMVGAVGLVREGGWLVFTEMGLMDDGENGNEKPTSHGSFNAPNHYRPAFTTQSLTKLFESYGLEDVYAERRGELPVFGLEEGKARVPCLIVRGRKGGRGE